MKLYLETIILQSKKGNKVILANIDKNDTFYSEIIRAVINKDIGQIDIAIDKLVIDENVEFLHDEEHGTESFSFFAEGVDENNKKVTLQIKPIISFIKCVKMEKQQNRFYIFGCKLRKWYGSQIELVYEN